MLQIHDSPVKLACFLSSHTLPAFLFMVSLTCLKGLFQIDYRQFAQDFVMNTEVRSGAIADLKEDEEDVYFSSYGHYGIHEEMIKVSKPVEACLSRHKDGSHGGLFISTLQHS